jgi:hypothetical protein
MSSKRGVKQSSADTASHTSRGMLRPRAESPIARLSTGTPAREYVQLTGHSTCRLDIEQHSVSIPPAASRRLPRVHAALILRSVHFYTEVDETGKHEALHSPASGVSSISYSFYARWKTRRAPISSRFTHRTSLSAYHNASNSKTHLFTSADVGQSTCR